MTLLFSFEFSDHIINIILIFSSVLKQITFQMCQHKNEVLYIALRKKCFPLNHLKLIIVNFRKYVLYGVGHPVVHNTRKRSTAWSKYGKDLNKGQILTKMDRWILIFSMNIITILLCIHYYFLCTPFKSMNVSLEKLIKYKLLNITIRLGMCSFSEP